MCLMIIWAAGALFVMVALVVVLCCEEPAA
jgi:hypothetical protein